MKKLSKTLSIMLVLCMVFAAVPCMSLIAAAAEEDASILIAAPECPRDSTCPMDRFVDLVKDEWYHDSIHYCIEKGIMDGVGGDYFDPEGTVDRAMAVTMLYRFEGEPAFMNDNTYTDVVRESYYEKAVVWASGKGIVQGYGNDEFGPDDPVTREQLAAMLFNYAKKYKEYDVSVGENTNILSYEDAFDISEYAYSAIQWACGAGIMQGDDNGCIRPGDNASRSELAELFRKFDENVAGNGDKPADITGGWKMNEEFAEAKIPENAKDAFDKAFEGYVGAAYTPVAYLGSQVVAGTNYAFLCSTTLVTAQPVTKLTVVKIYKDLSGNCSVLKITDVDFAECIAESDVEFVPADFAGGWNINTDYSEVLPENVKDAFSKATAGLLGVGYTPAAYLGSQVVAGFKYAVLCSAQTVTAEPTKALAVVVIYAAPDGNAEVLNISGFSIG